MKPGDVVAGRFEVERAAGVGGMGTVFRGHDRHTNRPVAIKALHTGNDEHLRRFAKEAEMLYKLQHPRIVGYVAHGRSVEGEVFLVMEWLEGETLGQRGQRQPLSIADAITVAKGVAEAMAVAHERGVVHRDIKPGNIFLLNRRVDDVCLLDFGLARLRKVRPGREITRTGELLGTPGYMAPEQARGKADIDARADVFSLGCVLFRCLTGRRAFEGDDPLAVLAKLVLEEPRRVTELNPAVPADIDDLIARMLTKDRAGRPADGSAVLAALDDLATIASEEALPISLREALPSITGREQRVMCLVLAQGDVLLDSGSITRTAGQTPSRGEVLRQAIQPFGGKLVRLIDGSLLVSVASGTPAEQAARAGRCALAIRAVLGSVPIVLAAGRGMVSGGALLGEAIDRAVVLLSLQRTDNVRIDEAAAALMRERFAVGRDNDGFFLSGACVDHSETMRTLLGRPTTCVGRARELRNLEALFEEAVAEPMARAVLVSSPAGAGKSRLRHEFLRRLALKGTVEDDEGRERPFQVWTGRGDPMSAGSAFQMIANALRNSAMIRSGESLDIRRQKLSQRLSRNVPEQDRERVAEFLGELVGAPSEQEPSLQLLTARRDPMVMGDQMRRAFEDLLVAECAHRPLLIVLEDLHWGDVPSVNFLDSALRNLADQPLMVLAFARPEIDELFPRLWQDHDLQRIQLQGLSKKAGAKLVRQVLGEQATDGLVQRLVEQSAGNAFYLEELIRAVAEGKGGKLPASVLAMAQARLEALGDESRRVLRAASVFGQTFWLGGVRSLIGRKYAVSELRDWLTDLCDREVVVRQPEPKFPRDVEFIFRHALLRQAAYAALTDEDRTLGHRLAGRWLEAAGEGEAVLLAEHFERGHEEKRAAVWYRRAAEQGLEGNDLEAALSRAGRGVECGAQGDVLAHLRLLQAGAHRWRGEFDEMETSAAQALELFAPGVDAWYSAIADRAVACRATGRYDELVALAEQLQHVEPERKASHAKAVARVAMQLFIIGWTKQGDQLLEHVGEHQDNPDACAWIHHARAFKLLHAGDPGAYLAACRRAADEFERAGDLRSVANSHVHLGFAFIELGAYAEAESALRSALTSAQRMGLHNVVATAKHNLGIVLARLDKLDEALEVETQAAVHSAAQGDQRIEGASRHYLATIHALRGELEESEFAATQGAELLRVAPPARAHALATLAAARLERGDERGSLRAAKEAFELMESLGGIEEGESLVRLVYARALHATDDVEGARSAIAEGVRRLEQRAAKISDEDWRHSFLERVPDNLALCQHAEKWFGVRVADTATDLN